MKGQSSNRSLLFNGTNYGYWKPRMRIYIQAIYFQLWRVIIKDPNTSTKKKNGVDVPKPEDE